MEVITRLKYNIILITIDSLTTHGKYLSEFKRSIESKVGYERIQLVTISRPSAYGAYEPYHFFDTEEEFAHAIEAM